MTSIGTANNRTILYQNFDTSLKWYENMPKENWLILSIVTNRNKFELSEISRRTIEHNACFVCCSGNQGELLHDIIDDDIVTREVEIENNYLPLFDIITTWHSDIESALWYSIYTANNNPIDISTIFCLNASEHDLERDLTNLITRFNDGYIPNGV